MFKLCGVVSVKKCNGIQPSNKLRMDLRIQLVGTCMTLVLLACFTSSFPSPNDKPLSVNQETLENHENGRDMGIGILNFFNPKTCSTRNSIRIVCNEDQETNETMCLIKKCCPAKEYIKCYKPIRDKAQWAFRISLLGLAVLTLLGCFPILCCHVLQRCKWTNPLQEENKEVSTLKRKQAEKTENIGGFILDLLKEDAEYRKKKKEELLLNTGKLKTDGASLKPPNGGFSERGQRAATPLIAELQKIVLNNKWTNPLQEENKEVSTLKRKQAEKTENIGGFILDLLKEDAEYRKKKKEGGFSERGQRAATPLIAELQKIVLNNKWTNPLQEENKEVSTLKRKQAEKTENIGGFILDLLKEDAEYRKKKKEGGFSERGQRAATPLIAELQKIVLNK
uniref:Fragile X mental retardation 1 neighbor protein isoform X2 n=1 Tax=Geotrypetes seraphini TaxID=260995 RepID=A0A6P8QP87_GEOSA|nr:fragile X mental retardation 1 neighbor protein isoform X2 [Geotrypetes seraphini]